MWQAFNVVELFAWKFQLFFAIHVDLHPNIENYRKVITSDSGIYILIALSAYRFLSTTTHSFVRLLNSKVSGANEFLRRDRDSLSVGHHAR